MIGGKNMSFVLSICGSNFSLMMGDNRMIRLNDNKIVNENLYKVIKINENICIGFAGDPMPIYFVYNQLCIQNIDNLSFQQVKEHFIKGLKKISTNNLGVKIIISGKNESGKFSTYCLDTKNAFKETIYDNIPTNGFSVVYAGSSETLVKPIVQRNIYDTMPWGDIETLKVHMKNCIKEIANSDNTVNDIVSEVMIL